MSRRNLVRRSLIPPEWRSSMTVWRWGGPVTGLLGVVGEETGDGGPQRLRGGEEALNPVLGVHTEPECEWVRGETSESLR